MALHKTIQASALWRKMLTMLFETGHPWITFKDPSQHPLAAGSRRRRAQLEPLHGNHAEHLGRRDGGLQSRLDQPGASRRRRQARRGAAGDDGGGGDAACSTTSSTSTSTRRRKRERSNLRHRPIGLGIMGFQDALFLLDIPFDSPEALDFADRMMEAVSYHAILTLVEAGGGARRVRDVQGLEVGPRAVPDRHARSAGARARHADRSVARAASRLGAGLRARQGARHAQLEHDGDCADGDDREHRRLLSRASSRSTRTSTSRRTSAASSRSSTTTWCATSRRSACGTPRCSIS